MSVMARARLRGRPKGAHLLLAMLVGAGSVTGCQAGEPVSVRGTEIISWPVEDGATAGQVVVTIRNESDRAVDPDVFGRGSQTVAHLLDGDGAELPGAEARIQLNAVPEVLGPGETGYLYGDFEIRDVPGSVADARIELNADDAEEPTEVLVEDFELTEDGSGLGAVGRLEWDGSGSAVARAIALDADGTPLGYVTTSEVRYDVGDFTMCCFPPPVEADLVVDVAVFGAQATAEE